MKPSPFGCHPTRWTAAGFLAVCLLVTTNGAWALSLGTMEVKSSFGDKFNAEVELKADPKKPIQVKIGSPVDYRQLGVTRPSVVDELVIPGTLEVQDGRQIFRVISPVPLFYPSFNLVLRAEQGGDTLLENYLITVDFRQSVSLRIKAERSQDIEDEKPEPVKPEPEPDTLGVAEPMVQTTPDAGMAPSGDIPEAPASSGTGGSSVVVAVHPAPLVVRELPEDSAVQTEPLPTPQPEPMEEAPPPVTVPKPPAETAPPVVESPQPMEAVARAPAPEQQEEPKGETPEAKPVKEPARPPVVLSRETYGPLKKGESLSSIISDLNLERQDPERLAVAVWMDNRDKFIKGNIHGLESGVELNLSSLDGRLQEIDTTRAHWMIQNHWQEWKVIKDRLKLASQIDLDPVVAQLLMPPAQRDMQATLHALVERWRSSWEAGDLEGHLALYAQVAPEPGKVRGYDYWKRFKQMMFQRHKKVRIQIAPPMMVHTGSKVVIAFDQWFDSNRMRSYGNKTLELIETKEGWKILNERFAVKKFLNKIRETGEPSGAVTEADFSLPDSLAFPLVVHAATQLDMGGAVEILNQLQTAGFNAYIAPLYVTPTKKIYRVLVGRVSDWDQAESLTRAVRGVFPARFAAPKRFPYSLKLGEFLEVKQAQARAEELRKLGLSTYLLTAGGGNFPNPVTQVLAGGFLEKENAKRFAEELGKMKIATELVSP